MFGVCVSLSVSALATRTQRKFRRKTVTNYDYRSDLIFGTHSTKIIPNVTHDWTIYVLRDWNG